MFHIVPNKLILQRHSALVALCLFFAITEEAHARRIKASVEYVFHDMIYLSSGDVAFTNSAKNSWLDQYGVFELDDDHQLLSVSSERKSKQVKQSFQLGASYSPSIVADLHTVQRIYSRMRSDWQESAQCFNMAHVWANDEFKNSGLKSMKMFLFFTRKYIRKYNFKWWFHVSPMVLLKDDNQSQVVILDRRYTLSPFDTKTWTDHFIISQKNCKQVSKFYDYYNHQESEDCYLISRNMYYWQPRSIRLGDQATGELSTFRSDEVRAAQAGF